MSDYAIGENYFIPFWCLLNYLDTTPPDPFIKCKLLDLSTADIMVDDIMTKIDTCTIQIFTGDIPNFPANHLIKPTDLREWADRIAEWFKAGDASNRMGTPND